MPSGQPPTLELRSQVDRTKPVQAYKVSDFGDRVSRFVYDREVQLEQTSLAIHRRKSGEACAEASHSQTRLRAGSLQGPLSEPFAVASVTKPRPPATWPHLSRTVGPTWLLGTRSGD